MNQLVLLSFVNLAGGLATFVRRLFPETNYWEVGAPSAMGGIAIDVVVILGDNVSNQRCVRVSDCKALIPRTPLSSRHHCYSIAASNVSAYA